MYPLSNQGVLHTETIPEVISQKSPQTCTPLRHDGNEDDRDDELHLWNRQKVFSTVWTMTPLIAHQRACKRPCPRTAPVNLHTVLWSTPAMMTDILGLRQPRGAKRKGHRKNPANQALHMLNKTFWSTPAMMPSIMGLPTTAGNTARGAS